jgi:hypothetical protein
MTSDCAGLRGRLEIRSRQMPEGKPDSLTKEKFHVLAAWGAV